MALSLMSSSSWKRSKAMEKSRAVGCALCTSMATAEMNAASDHAPLRDCTTACGYPIFPFYTTRGPSSSAFSYFMQACCAEERGIACERKQSSTMAGWFSGINLDQLGAQVCERWHANCVVSEEYIHRCYVRDISASVSTLAYAC